MINLNTPVVVPPSPVKIDFDITMLSMGSCFADEIGALMADSGFCIEQNPFGTMYNPLSIAQVLRMMRDDKEVDEGDLVLQDGLWHSWLHHGRFSRSSKDECMAACNEAVHRGHKALANAKLLMVTFGTAWVYERTGEEEKSRVVANCHKVPVREFERRRLSVAEIVEVWRLLLQELRAFNPQLDCLFTVSPIRHMADGAHENQLSKSTLLLAVDELAEEYFPAYEIVLDELRDYRFYAADMAHPSPLAVQVVWERFQETYMTPAIRNQAHINYKNNLKTKHKPIYQQ